MIYDFCIVGAGCVGTSVAYKLSQRFPDANILLLEKEDRIAAHQTGRNSGVIHSGVYYKPGSKKAVNCKQGREALVEFSEENGVPYEVTGKVIVATTEEELQQLFLIFDRGIKNGMDKIRMIGPEEIREFEPECAGIRGIYVPYSGIIDYPAASRKFWEKAAQQNANNTLHYGQTVQALKRLPDGYAIQTREANYRARYLITCAGLHSDRLARMDELFPGMRIVGFRGDYYELTPQAVHRVKNLIYPVPNPAFPFLGVHFTRMIHGGIECGPNAVFVFSREGYEPGAFNWQDTREALGYGGTWRLFAKHWQFGLDELRKANNKELFWQQLKRLLPTLKYDELVPGRCGVRAQAVDPNGKLVDDFRYAETPQSIHVLNAPSPAATASLAIAEDILQKAIATFGLENPTAAAVEETSSASPQT